MSESERETKETWGQKLSRLGQAAERGDWRAAQADPGWERRWLIQGLMSESAAERAWKDSPWRAEPDEMVEALQGQDGWGREWARRVETMLRTLNQEEAEAERSEAIAWLWKADPSREDHPRAALAQKRAWEKGWSKAPLMSAIEEHLRSDKVDWRSEKLWGALARSRPEAQWWDQQASEASLGMMNRATHWGIEEAWESLAGKMPDDLALALVAARAMPSAEEWAFWCVQPGVEPAIEALQKWLRIEEGGSPQALWRIAREHAKFLNQWDGCAIEGWKKLARAARYEMEKLNPNARDLLSAAWRAAAPASLEGELGAQAESLEELIASDPRKAIQKLVDQAERWETDRPQMGAELVERLWRLRVEQEKEDALKGRGYRREARQAIEAPLKELMGKLWRAPAPKLFEQAAMALARQGEDGLFTLVEDWRRGSAAYTAIRGMPGSVEHIEALMRAAPIEARWSGSPAGEGDRIWTGEALDRVGDMLMAAAQKHPRWEAPAIEWWKRLARFEPAWIDSLDQLHKRRRMSPSALQWIAERDPERFAAAWSKAALDMNDSEIQSGMIAAEWSKAFEAKMSPELEASMTRALARQASLEMRNGVSPHRRWERLWEKALELARSLGGDSEAASQRVARWMSASAQGWMEAIEKGEWKRLDQSAQARMAPWMDRVIGWMPQAAESLMSDPRPGDESQAAQCYKASLMAQALRGQISAGDEGWEAIDRMPAEALDGALASLMAPGAKASVEMLRKAASRLTRWGAHPVSRQTGQPSALELAVEPAGREPGMLLQGDRQARGEELIKELVAMGFKAADPNAPDGWDAISLAMSAPKLSSPTGLCKLLMESDLSAIGQGRAASMLARRELAISEKMRGLIASRVESALSRGAMGWVVSEAVATRGFDLALSWLDKLGPSWIAESQKSPEIKTLLGEAAARGANLQELEMARFWMSKIDRGWEPTPADQKELGAIVHRKLEELWRFEQEAERWIKLGADPESSGPWSPREIQKARAIGWPLTGAEASVGERVGLIALWQTRKGIDRDAAAELERAMGVIAAGFAAPKGGALEKAAEEFLSHPEGEMLSQHWAGPRKAQLSRLALEAQSRPVDGSTGPAKPKRI